MDNINIALVTDDRDYGKALGMALLNVCREFVIKLYSKDRFFDDMHKFYERSEEGLFTDSFDLVLWDGEEAEELYGDNIVLVAEQEAMTIKDFSEKRFCIYKYSCARSLVSDLLEIYGALTGRKPAGISNVSARFFAFASWLGGTGCSTLAVAAGRELCRFYGKGVLYISLEEIESTGNFIPGYSGAKTMGQYLYHLFKEEPDNPYLESYVLKDEYGLEAFAPTVGRNPLRDMSECEWNVFIDNVVKSGHYDIVILDVGNCLTDIDLACMEIAEKICLVTLPENNRFREEQYMQYLICRCGETAADRIIKIVNMSDEQPKAEADLYVGKSRYFVDENNIRKISEDGEFSKKVQTLTEILAEPAAKTFLQF